MSRKNWIQSWKCAKLYNPIILSWTYQSPSSHVFAPLIMRYYLRRYLLLTCIIVIGRYMPLFTALIYLSVPSYFPFEANPIDCLKIFRKQPYILSRVLSLGEHSTAAPILNSKTSCCRSNNKALYSKLTIPKILNQKISATFNLWHVWCLFWCFTGMR